MIALNAHFDGKVIVPDEPLDLQVNQKIRISIEPIEAPATDTQPRRILGQQRDLVVNLSPDWDAPLPDDFWDHNGDDEGNR